MSLLYYLNTTLPHWDLYGFYWLQFIPCLGQDNSHTIMEESQSYIGMWVTKDGYIRQQLLSTGRYDEARGNRKSAYTGSYSIEGNHIEYADDTGFTADGDFIDGVLHHGGYVFYKEVKQIY